MHQRIKGETFVCPEQNVSDLLTWHSLPFLPLCALWWGLNPHVVGLSLLQAESFLSEHHSSRTVSDIFYVFSLIYLFIYTSTPLQKGFKAIVHQVCIPEWASGWVTSRPCPLYSDLLLKISPNVTKGGGQWSKLLCPLNKALLSC